MLITVAKTAGFCFGVKRAVSMAYANVGMKGVFTYGNIINNEHVVNALKENGIRPIEDINLIPNGSIVIIRAHGISKDDEEFLKYLKKCRVIDATCPYVKKIHRIVADECANHRKVVIVGNKDHPEVIGISGRCCDGVVVLENEKDENLNKIADGGISVVSQTTMKNEIFENVVNVIKKKSDDVKIFCTICEATCKRQSEAAQLAKEYDAVFVVGSENSSNTKKLFEICSEFCSNTFMVADAADMEHKRLLVKDKFNFMKQMKLAVTAGASTPAEIIKGVISVIEQTESTMSEINFEDALEETLKPLNSGDIVKGIVIDVNPSEIRVDLGVKSDGIIPMAELTNCRDASIYKDIKLGQEIDIFVVRVNDAEGIVTLSLKKVNLVKAHKELEHAIDTKEILTGRVVEVVNGGILVNRKGVNVFVPASQASERYVKNLDEFLNRDVSFRVIEIKARRKNIIGSIKSAEKEIKKYLNDIFWQQAHVGQKISGVVKLITDFGAFVDVGGVDGLLHISELSWNKIKHPSEILAVNDNIEVYIKALNKENGRVSLGYRKIEDSPWYASIKQLKISDIVTCKVVRLVPFGAFVKIVPNVDGLIHISQICCQHISHPSEKLSIGQQVQAKIIDINTDAQQILLSIKAILEECDQAAISDECVEKSAIE